MDGSATPIMETSKPSRNSTMQSVMRRAQVRPAHAEEVEGLPVGAEMEVIPRKHSMRLHSMQQH